MALNTKFVVLYTLAANDTGREYHARFFIILFPGTKLPCKGMLVSRLEGSNYGRKRNFVQNGQINLCHVLSRGVPCARDCKETISLIPISTLIV